MSDSDFTPLFINEAAEGESFNDLPYGGSSFNQDNNQQNFKGKGQKFKNKTYSFPDKQQKVEKDLLERVPPHNITAEKAIIGGVFLNYSLMHSLVDTIKPDDFYVPAHQILFQAFVDLYSLSRPIDPNSLHIHLEDNQKLEQVGGLAYLGEIAEFNVSEENAKHYAEVVRDRAMQRALIGACAEIIGNSYNPASQVDELLADSEKSIFAVSERKTTKSFQSIGQLTHQIFEIATQRSQQKSSVTGIPTDYTELDRITAGLQPSDLIILAARPAMGKTAFALNLAMRTAIHFQTPVAIFSLEMSSVSLVERMISLWAKVELTNLKRGFLNDEDWNKLQTAANQFEKAPIYIDDTGELNTLSLRAKCRRLKAEHGLKFVIVDYLQLMRSSRNESRELEISDISRNLKALAKELDVPVLALSQLNRKVEERADKRPMLSDLRESGAIEQDADIIMFIHRDDAYNKDGSRPMTNEAEIIIGKHRNGATGTVKLAFLSKYTAFENLQQEFIQGE